MRSLCLYRFPFRSLFLFPFRPIPDSAFRLFRSHGELRLHSASLYSQTPIKRPSTSGRPRGGARAPGPPPPYLRVWMTAPPSPYLQVWFWPFSHCMDRSSDVKRIWEEQCFASCLGRLILSVNLSIYKYDFYSSISPSRQVVPFLTCTLNEQVVEHLPGQLE